MNQSKMAFSTWCWTRLMPTTFISSDHVYIRVRVWTSRACWRMKYRGHCNRTDRRTSPRRNREATFSFTLLLFYVFEKQHEFRNICESIKWLCFVAVCSVHCGSVDGRLVRLFSHCWFSFSLMFVMFKTKSDLLPGSHDLWRNWQFTRY